MDIRLVSTDDLIREVESRSKTFICAYQTYEQDDKTGNIMYWFGKGMWMDAVGMSSVLHNDCMNNWNGELQTLQRINEEEGDSNWEYQRR